MSPNSVDKPQVMMLTGCASGIGKHVAGVLHKAGHSLLLTDVNLEGLERVAEQNGWREPQVLVRKLDVRDAAAWEALIELALQTWGRLDVLMNIAGIVLPGYVHEVEPEIADRHIDINTMGPIYGTRAAARAMIKQGHGQVINIASLASLAPIPGIALYSASKFAVRAFSLAVAHELRRYGVKVTVICPDAVETPMLDLQMDYPEASLSFGAKRILQVDDVAAAIETALRTKPLEITIPRHRGWLAKLANAWPRLATWIMPSMLNQGLSRQAEYSARKGHVPAGKRTAASQHEPA